MSGMGEEVVIGRNPQADAEHYVADTTAALTRNPKFDPSEVLVQVLRRPSDPICSKLENCIHLWTASGIAYQPLVDGFGGWIDVARNWQASAFRRTKFKYLLIIDADVGPPIETPVLLARHDLPVVSALVPSFNNQRGLFFCVAVKGADGKAFFPTADGTKTVPSRGVCEIHNAGTGCLMVRRDVIEALWQNYENGKKEEKLAKAAMVKALGNLSLDRSDQNALMAQLKRMDFEEDLSGPPFSIPQSVRDRGAEIGNMPKGEDIMFTDRVRAAGFKMYADFECRCTHEKVLTLQWPSKKVDPELDIEDWKVSAFDLPVVVGA